MDPADKTRQRLLEAAGQIFAERGFDGTTVREICKRADVNIAAVNYHFRDKERLYIEAVKHASCGSHLRAAVASHDPAAAPADRLRDFIRAFVGRMLDRDRPAWHARLMMREMAQPSAACEELVRDFIRPTAEALHDILKDMLPPATPRWKRMMTGISIVGQCLHYLQCKPVVQQLLGDDYARLTPEVIADHVTRFSLAALERKPG